MTTQPTVRIDMYKLDTPKAELTILLSIVLYIVVIGVLLTSCTASGVRTTDTSTPSPALYRVDWDSIQYDREKRKGKVGAMQSLTTNMK